MVDTARRFPFLFLLPTLISGVVTGDNISPKSAVHILLYTATVVIILAFTKRYRDPLIQLSIPIITFNIGVLASVINIAETLNINESLIDTSIFNNIKEALILKNRAAIEDPTISALSNAICLGEKSGLNDEIKELFAKCGIMHIVAVSGLHVGAIYIMIQKVLQTAKTGIMRSKVIAIIFIWFYALIIGAPASVIRAAAILTYIIVGEINNKSFSSLNGIIACAFFTLIIAPGNLYNLSFQLSYAAYIGIILILPVFTPAKKGGNKIAKNIVASISVSIAAQLLTMPITIYYFHGTSINSFILNIIVIPLTSLLLYCNIFVLFTPQPISNILGNCVEFLGSAIIYVTELIEPINIYIDNIFMNEASLIIYYITIFTIFTITPKYLNRKI